MRSATESVALQRIREQAAQRFDRLGWPATTLEEWKYTNLAPLQRRVAAGAFTRREAVAGVPDSRGFSMHGQAVAELVFIDGIFAPQASTLPNGARVSLRVSTLSTANPGMLEKHFARYADHQTHPMTALNTANAIEGAVIEVGEQLDGFLHFLFIGSEGFESHPRNLIVVRRGSQIAVVETYVGSGTYFTNTVTEIVAGEGAIVDHSKLQCESTEAFHIGTVQIHQERSSSVTARSVSLGGALVRNETNAVLRGEGASLVLDGLFVLTGTQHVDNHTVIDHAVPHGESLELYKGVLDESSRGIFDGRIIVRPDARKTISRQVNHNLILSETAIIDSKPTLEIHNDDVKCNHGSTIGQIEQEPMFYLRSRGISEADARNLLIYAFASEIVDRMKIEPVREQIRQAMFRQMPGRVPERREGWR